MDATIRELATGYVVENDKVLVVVCGKATGFEDQYMAHVIRDLLNL